MYNVYIRPIHWTKILEFWKFSNLYCYMDQYKDMLENKFCSINAPSAGTLQCKLQWAISQKMISGYNFWLECPTKVRSTQLSYIFKALFRDTPLAYNFFRTTCHLSPDHLSTCHLPPGTWNAKTERRKNYTVSEEKIVQWPKIKFSNERRKKLCSEQRKKLCSERRKNCAVNEEKNYAASEGKKFCSEWRKKVLQRAKKIIMQEMKKRQKYAASKNSYVVSNGKNYACEQREKYAAS